MTHESDIIRIYEGSSCDEKLMTSISGESEIIELESTFDIITIKTYNSDYIFQRRYSIEYTEL